MKTKDEKRCDCGKLLFKWTSRGLEFKCQRCKRIHLIPFDLKSAEYRKLCPLENTTDQDTD